MSLVSDTRVFLAAQLPGWREARINDEEVSQFPAWRVDFGGAGQRGSGWLSIVEVEVMVGYAGAVGNEDAIEQFVIAMLDILRDWPSVRVSDVGAAETIVLTNGAFYGVTIRITGVRPQ